MQLACRSPSDSSESSRSLLSRQSCGRLPVISFSCKITGSANLPQLLQVLFIEIYYDLLSVGLVPAIILERTWLFLLSPFLHCFDTGNVRSQSRPCRTISLSCYTADLLFLALSAVAELSTSRHSLSIYFVYGKIKFKKKKKDSYAVVLQKKRLHSLISLMNHILDSDLFFKSGREFSCTVFLRSQRTRHSNVRLRCQFLYQLYYRYPCSPPLSFPICWIG